MPTRKWPVPKPSEGTKLTPVAIAHLVGVDPRTVEDWDDIEWVGEGAGRYLPLDQLPKAPLVRVSAVRAALLKEKFGKRDVQAALAGMGNKMRLSQERFEKLTIGEDRGSQAVEAERQEAPPADRQPEAAPPADRRPEVREPAKPARKRAAKPPVRKPGAKSPYYVRDLGAFPLGHTASFEVVERRTGRTVANCHSRDDADERAATLSAARKRSKK